MHNVHTVYTAINEAWKQNKIDFLDWGSLQDRAYLKSGNSYHERVNYLKYNQYEEHDVSEERLETHHTHFFFVDDGVVGGKGDVESLSADEKFRTQFENYILETVLTPIVLVLIQVKHITKCF